MYWKVVSVLFSTFLRYKFNIHTCSFVLSEQQILFFHIIKEVNGWVSESIIVLSKSLSYMLRIAMHFLFLIPLGKSFSSFILHLIHFLGQKEAESELLLLLLARSRDIMEKKRHGFGDADHRTHSFSAEAAAVTSSPALISLTPPVSSSWRRVHNFVDGENSIYFNRSNLNKQLEIQAKLNGPLSVRELRTRTAVLELDMLLYIGTYFYLRGKFWFFYGFRNCETGALLHSALQETFQSAAQLRAPASKRTAPTALRHNNYIQRI